MTVDVDKGLDEGIDKTLSKWRLGFYFLSSERSLEFNLPDVYMSITSPDSALLKSIWSSQIFKVSLFSTSFNSIAFLFLLLLVFRYTSESKIELVGPTSVPKILESVLESPWLFVLGMNRDNFLGI
jgi:hypothetical protein